jgi:hypothetical protein
MYLIYLYIFMVFRENIEKAGALAVLRIGPPETRGVYLNTINSIAGIAA